MFLRRKKESGYRPAILITGCSSGIGLALAKALSQIPSYRVIATARESSLDLIHKAGLKETDRIRIRALDVAIGTERKKVVDEITRDWGGVDILINNAGISYRAVVEHMDEKSELEQLRVNYLAPMALIRLVLPSMREKGRGKIINISSVSGMLAMPTMSSYTASKFALEGASEALWYEMKPLGINVSLVQPGFIKSKSFEHVYYSEESSAAQESGGLYADYYRNMKPLVEKMMNASRTTPEKIAATVLRVIRKENPPLRIPATLDAVFFYYLRRWMPRRFFHPFLFYCLPNARKWANEYSKARNLK